MLKNKIVILDGGTGTDIQRRGATMSGESWCADANLTHPEIVAAAHRDYIAAGAHVITANTFASSALLFNALGRNDDLLKIDRAAMRIAKEAANGVPVAGSVSTMRPVIAGTDRTSKQREWPEAEARALLRRKVENLAEAGADLLFCEMMRDADYSIYAIEAALATGLPVLAGLSVERRADGELTGFGREDQLLRDFAPKLAALKPQAMAIMHTSPNDTGDALAILKESWTGPLGAYPESGYFKMPDWQFENIIPPAELVKLARGWKALGVTIFGGCCGTGPEHIRALAAEFS